MGTKRNTSLPGQFQKAIRRASAVPVTYVQPTFYPCSLPYQISPIPESGGSGTDARSIWDVPIDGPPVVANQTLVYDAGANRLVWRVPPGGQVYSCPASVAVGDPVYEAGDLAVAGADAVDITKAPALGLVAAKPTATTCTVQQVGELTVPYALPADDSELFLAVGGGVTQTAPNSQNNVVQGLAQVVSQAGRIILAHVDPENYYIRA
jgi:hypothetical protein